ncbi:RNAse P Rpr2/Rpp21/SNM1 subunit domain-domain-containing protein [Microdochium bolleyi]|uniref:RNAse P Rpr2/Rpp21/SNM1 subunit domain-domain-containing protein n=1 Tax=Microdochium bolleyi TaxID=196109 RepID=A0A136JA86_9PEZI|nr:RNAse P Rpr2/Rpp21/SNM1 subunit domain-domain-containing protein [Microdochium bolleyi]
MAKIKGAGNVPNRPIYARMSFLYQAAAYLSNHAGPQSTADSSPRGNTADNGEDSPGRVSDLAIRDALSRRYMTDMRSTSKKAQISMSPALKHTICKYCDTLLVEGQNSTAAIENLSRGGRKPWADMLVVTCHTCGGFKRFPVHVTRQKGRPSRAVVSADNSEPPTGDAAVDEQNLSSAMSTGLDST